MERRKALTFDEIKTASLIETPIEGGVVYFLPPSTKRSLDLKRFKDADAEESLDAMVDLMVDVVRDEEGERICASREQFLELPTTTFLELSRQFKALMGIDTDEKDDTVTVPLEQIPDEDSLTVSPLPSESGT